jgi:hypothetical protein
MYFAKDNVRPIGIRYNYLKIRKHAPSPPPSLYFRILSFFKIMHKNLSI